MAGDSATIFHLGDESPYTTNKRTERQKRRGSLINFGAAIPMLNGPFLVFLHKEKKKSTPNFVYLLPNSVNIKDNTLEVKIIIYEPSNSEYMNTTQILP